MSDPIAALEHRLRTGERMCEAEPDPDKRERLETFWINLLRQYEAAIDAECDQEVQAIA